MSIPLTDGVMAGMAERPAVVAKVGWVNGLATIRSLGRAGIPVVALDQNPTALGFRSRYAEARVSPDPVTDESGYVRFLGELGDAIGEPVPIFASNDEHLNAIARNRETLGDRFLYPCPPWERLGRIQDKWFQIEQAQALGVACPRTSHEPTEDFGFPVLVKPADPAAFWRAFREKAFRCTNRAELEEAFEHARPYRPLVQELIPGGDDELYTLGSYLTRDGEVIGLFSGRKLRQTPPGVGTCRVAEAVWVDDVVEQGLRLLRGVEFHGISQVEFKRDPRDGIFKLMEINPRLWQWHGLASACGVDLPLIAYRDLLGERRRPVSMNGRPRRWAITLVTQTTPVISRPPYVEAIFARDDLWPALAYVERLLPHTLRRFTKVGRRLLRGILRRG